MEHVRAERTGGALHGRSQELAVERDVRPLEAQSELERREVVARIARRFRWPADVARELVRKGIGSLVDVLDAERVRVRSGSRMAEPVEHEERVELATQVEHRARAPQVLGDHARSAATRRGQEHDVLDGEPERASVRPRAPRADPIEVRADLVPRAHAHRFRRMRRTVASRAQRCQWFSSVRSDRSSTRAR